MENTVPFSSIWGDWGDPCQSSLSARKARCVQLPEFSQSPCLACSWHSQSYGMCAQGRWFPGPFGEGSNLLLFHVLFFFFLDRVPVIGSHQSSLPGNKAPWSPQGSDPGWETTNSLSRAPNLQLPPRTGLRGTDQRGEV